MEKRVQDIFGTPSNGIDFDGAEKLVADTVIELDDFNIIYSPKYEANCALIRGKDGQTWSTWSSVVIRKLTELKALDQTQWQGLTVVTVKRVSKGKREYLDLQLV